jgi:hypothetical protein
MAATSLCSFPAIVAGIRRRHETRLTATACEFPGDIRKGTGHMNSRRSCKAAVIFFLTCAAAAIGDHTVSGQTSSMPAVNVVRDTELFWTM